MSVFELAIYMRISRATVAHRPSEITATLMHWFDCDIDPRDVEDTCRTMVGKGWLIPFKDGLRATLAGRRAGSLHLRGLVRMMDMGTKMLDVAHWLTWLRIAGRELDGDRMEEDLGDPTLVLADDDDDDDDELTQEGRSDG
ncbi:hypothetical protein [Sphingomonas sp. Leaf4]|uniref:hypothetical protein n=1 Tax=Sphingomonas sp. Leaf4 TaxID=2876553 RepID=UPI001E2FC73D|nr:hypothetical protein [Sphingomonas sp. Leaf4]